MHSQPPACTGRPFLTSFCSRLHSGPAGRAGRGEREAGMYEERGEKGMERLGTGAAVRSARLVQAAAREAQAMCSVHGGGQNSGATMVASVGSRGTEGGSVAGAGCSVDGNTTGRVTGRGRSMIMGLPQHNGAGWEPAYDCLLSVRGTKTSGRGGATYEWRWRPGTAAQCAPPPGRLLMTSVLRLAPGGACGEAHDLLIEPGSANRGAQLKQRRHSVLILGAGRLIQVGLAQHSRAAHGQHACCGRRRGGGRLARQRLFEQRHAVGDLGATRLGRHRLGCSLRHGGRRGLEAR